MTRTYALYTAFGIALIVAALSVFYLSTNEHAFASVAVSNEYNATTTFAASAPSVRVIKPGSGTLGSVVITGKNTGLMTLYDATTSDVTQRAAGLASTTILLADFPTNAPEGTYTFDVQTKYGILLVTSGSVATSTITTR